MPATRKLLSIFSFASFLMAFASAQATTVLQMNLDQLTAGAQTIVRGSVIDVRETAVVAGGGELPALIYRVEVSEVFKGDVPRVKDIRLLEFMMIGKIDAARNDRPMLPGLPVIRSGEEYLLFIAPAGPVGLTSTMGLAQGHFSFLKSSGTEMVVNGSDNVGLFKGMDVTAAASRGPAAYAEVARLIRDRLGNRGGENL